jgi:3',5'-cyclic AMP phosphodiesterase CpdA
MADYEFNFYFPFKGLQKPIYAIPGNHDWFDALEGFNANFLEPQAARAALDARVNADLHLTSTNTRRIDTLVTEGARLRNLYNIDNNNQRGSFFEIQTPDFALVAIDTGIQRTVDERQWSWLQGALDRARGKFIMAIVGHPRFAGGKDTSVGDEKFAALYQLLESRGVTIAMAGDTHDFEYYKTKDRSGSSRGYALFR